MTTFSKAEMKKASNVIRKSIKANKGLPKEVSMKSREGKTVKVDKKHYAGLFEAQNVYIRRHGRYPNYVTLNSVANNPLVMDYQDNAYTCGPTSFSMATQMLYDYVSESKIAKLVNCVYGSGTSPSDLVGNAGKIGYKLVTIPRNFSSVKKCLDKGFPVIAHIHTKPATCLGFINDYGHYVLIYGYTSSGYYKVADPTKGLISCTPKILDKATNGRDIKYYKVEIK